MFSRTEIPHQTKGVPYHGRLVWLRTQYTVVTVLLCEPGRPILQSSTRPPTRVPVYWDRLASASSETSATRLGCTCQELRWIAYHANAWRHQAQESGVRQPVV
jgi:hypothetical protein